MTADNRWLAPRVVLAGLILFSSMASARDAVDIPYTKTVLENGLTVIVHEDKKAPIVAVNIWYHVGSKNEIPGRTGFAHLFEHLMFQGSENFNDEYLLYLQQLGATNLNATTWFDRTNYFETVPTNTLDTVLWLESDRMGHFAGAISQDKLDEQRGVVQNEKRQGDNQPYGKVWELMLRQVFPDQHPYSWETIGSMEDLNAATLEDVKEWFGTYYGPNNAVLVLAGDIDTDEAIEKVEKYFGDIPAGPPLTKPDTWIPTHTSDRRMTMEDRVPQSRIYMSWVGPAWGTKDAHELALASDIIGGGKNSRLFERLVYTDQIATDASFAYQPLEISGISYLVASAQPDVALADIERVIREEIARFIDKGPTRKELERAKIQARAGFLRGIERVGGFSGKAGVLAESMVYGGTPDYYNRELANIEAATAEDLRKQVERWMGPGAFALEVKPYPTLAANDEGADRSAPPAPGAFPDVGFPAFSRTRLSNGLELVFAPRSGTPVVEVSLLVDAGYAADQFAGAGTASFAMAMLDEGTRTRTALEISEDLALLGANMGTNSNLDSSSVELSALPDKLDESLEIFADVVLNPTFPDSEIERLRKSALANIRQEQIRPISMALRVLPSLMYGPDHAYRQPLTGSGTLDSIAALTREDLVNFHNDWFKPNHATLVVVGDLEKQALVERIEDLFADWKAGDTPKKRLDTADPVTGKSIYVVDRPDSDQSVIFAGQLLPPRSNSDELAIQAMNDILGGKSSARINMNLREDKSWSYGAYSVILDARGQRPLLAYAPVQTDKTSESLREMMREISDITDDRPPAAEELEIVKRSDTLSLPGRWEAAGDVLGALDELVEYGLPDDYWSSYAERVNALSVADVSAAASAYVDADSLTWVVVGDLKKIQPGLLELGFESVRLVDADGNFLD